MSQVKDLHAIEGLKRWTASTSRTRSSATISSSRSGSLVNLTELMLDEDSIATSRPIANLKKLDAAQHQEDRREGASRRWRS